MSIAPSGAQYEISHADQHATVVEVGGGIRQYSRSGREVLNPYPEDAICDGAHGSPLIPWPNRLADGRYDFDGSSFQVALTEPTKGNAIHGFLRWRSWQAVEHTASSVTMATTLHPLSGYPFALAVEIRYSLGETGLVVTTKATNVGDRALPYGSGQHPYLSPGTGRIDDCELTLAAATRITTDEERQLPDGREAVAGTPYDFRTGRRLGRLAIDFAFTDLSRDESGRAWVRLRGGDGRTAQLWVDESYPLVELYTADTLAPERRRSGLGAEPMTCPPNAFASGEGVIRLEPGAETVSSWGASLA